MTEKEKRIVIMMLMLQQHIDSEEKIHPGYCYIMYNTNHLDLTTLVGNLGRRHCELETISNIIKKIQEDDEIVFDDVSIIEKCIVPVLIDFKKEFKNN